MRTAGAASLAELHPQRRDHGEKVRGHRKDTRLWEREKLERWR